MWCGSESPSRTQLRRRDETGGAGSQPRLMIVRELRSTVSCMYVRPRGCLNKPQLRAAHTVTSHPWLRKSTKQRRRHLRNHDCDGISVICDSFMNRDSRGPCSRQRSSSYQKALFITLLPSILRASCPAFDKSSNQ